MKLFKILITAVIFLFISNNTSQAGLLKKLVRKYHKVQSRCKIIKYIIETKINGQIFVLATIIADKKNIEIIGNTSNPLIQNIQFLLGGDIPDIDQNRAQQGKIPNALTELFIAVPQNGNIKIPNFFEGKFFMLKIAYQMNGLMFKTKINKRFDVCIP